MVLPMSGTQPRAARRDGTIVFVATLLINAAVAAAIGSRGWDDGAITMAFADTFAHTGRISITPASEVVEGFSSPFWLLLLAGVYRLVPLGFGGMILAAQLLTGLSAALGATLLWDLLRRSLPRMAVILSVAVFTYAPFLIETANGMEMTALSVVVLAILRLITRTRSSASALFALAALVPWIRLEAAGYLLVAFAAMIVLARDSRRARPLILGTLTSLLALTAARFAVFGAVIPNTILAKRWAVYGADSLAQHIGIPLIDLGYALAPGALVALFSIGMRSPAIDLASIRHGTVHRSVAYVAGYVVAVGLFNEIAGYNWGYHGRMQQSIIAPAVVVAVWIAPAASRRSLDSLRRIASVVLAMACLTVFGIFFAGEEEMTRTLPIGRADDTTPMSIAATARAVDDIRARLNLPVMSVLIPDIGGTALCCRQLQILDLGMLADRKLARDGYEAAGRYVEEKRPDAIVDPSWGAGSKIYETSYFADNYEPIASGERWIYLRRDRLVLLENQCSWISVEQARSLWYNPDGFTETFLRERGAIPVCRLGP